MLGLFEQERRDDQQSEKNCEMKNVSHYIQIRKNQNHYQEGHSGQNIILQKKQTGGLVLRSLFLDLHNPNLWFFGYIFAKKLEKNEKEGGKF